MPTEEATDRERRAMVLRGIQHHLHHAVHVMVRRRERTDVEAQLASDGGPDLDTVQQFALDLGRLEHVERQGLQRCFRLQREAQ